MKKLLVLLGLLTLLPARYAPLHAADAPAAPAALSVEQRVADLEAYINNVGRGSDAADAKVTSNVSAPGPGHNAWMMTCAALVLFMTLPGLALFYGGLVRRKNVLSVLAQCLGIAGLVTILWWLCGYSLVFGDVQGAGGDASTFLGNLKHAFFNGVDSSPNTNYAYWVSHNVFAMYQLMFAIITPSLILGAVAERMKFSAVLLFVTLWMFVVYFPLAHMVWGIDGAMNGVWNAAAKIKAIDFAGGTVVHMSSGWSALILCMVLGKRLGFGREAMPPHSMVLCMVGTGMLWVGWYGFNAGSALAADGIAANAFTTTTIATAVASFVWAMAEYALKGKPSILGFCSGAVAGLVVITPATGFVTASGAVIIGILAGIIPFLAVSYLKAKLGYDDALDTFGVHAVGGTLGAFMTGVLARSSANANLETNLGKYVANKAGFHFDHVERHSFFGRVFGYPVDLLRSSIENAWASITQPLVLEQIKAIVLTLVLAIVGTAVIAYVVKAIVGLRVDEEVETVGLDLAEHGEEGYHST